MTEIQHYFIWKYGWYLFARARYTNPFPRTFGDYIYKAYKILQDKGMNDIEGSLNLFCRMIIAWLHKYVNDTYTIRWLD